MAPGKDCTPSTSLSDWTDADYWRKICPALSIEGTVPSRTEDGRDCSGVSAEESERRRKRLIDDGFVTVDDSTFDPASVEKLHCGIQAVHTVHGYPASFLFLFDEAWEMARMSQKIMRVSVHKTNQFHFDLLAWCIESGGFSPHRDRQPKDSIQSFHPDQQAKFVTHWVALTEAAPENSCLYVVPKRQDPGYTNGDNDDDKDPLREALPDKQAFQNIRALPRTRGQSILFTHRIIHWGSARDPNTALPPREAISFVSCDPQFEKPYVDPKYFTSASNPPFPIRLLLVCAQILIYYQRFNLPKDMIKSCYQYCKSHEQELEESYRRKVFVEFVKAMKEAGEAFNEDDEDAVLEHMLDGETNGYGEFEDDFDNMDDDKPKASTSDSDGDAGSGGEGEDEEFDDEDDLVGVSLFGSSKDSPSKRIKLN